MRIKHLKINGFGKLKNKDINLKDGINIIYGENEAGKSTLLKFISSMFYGASKNKNGKNIPDFDRFKPWKTEEYSGSIDYSLDNGEEYTVYREFKKKNPSIYNSSKEDITKTFKEERSGINFFEEQTGIDEETYFNTAISEQNEVSISLNKQNGLVQRISNFVLSGDDNISYQKSLNQISKLQTENVGTERTSLRPINIVNNRIETAKARKKELDELKNNYKEDNLGTEKLNFRLKSNEKKLAFLKRVKEFNENNRLKLAEINFNKNAVLEDDERINEIKEELEEISNDEDIPQKLNKTPYIIGVELLSFLEFILLLLTIIFFRKRTVEGMPINYRVEIILDVINIFANPITCIIPIVLICILLLLMKSKSNNLKNSKAKESFSKKNKLKFELDTLKEKKRNRESEIKKKNEKLEFEIDNEKDILVNEFLKVLDINFIDEVLDKSYEEILKEIELFEQKVSDIKLDMKELEINKKNFNTKMEELSKFQEELNSAIEEKEELISLNNSYNIAKECLEKAYKETKKNISPRFTNNLCSTIEKISDGKYKKVALNDEDGIIVELENGNNVPIERLSIGTIDQMYLSLRVSAIKEISNEKLPIILDEAFAYFDNNRLENALSFLKDNYKDNQILIFTCSNREKEVLDKLNIEYNLINLEK